MDAPNEVALGVRVQIQFWYSTLFDAVIYSNLRYTDTYIWTAQAGRLHNLILSWFINKIQNQVTSNQSPLLLLTQSTEDLPTVSIRGCKTLSQPKFPARLPELDGLTTPPAFPPNLTVKKTSPNNSRHFD